MRLESLSLGNFKSYERGDVSFDPGVTVIHGVNGSGKSSLLEACFFALYGADALEGTLDEIVTTGQSESEITLAFTHEGHRYEIAREIRVRNDRAQTAQCELDTPEGPISGARAARSEIVSLLRMDADAFLNCAYVRQGEVNKLIQASPAERQDMIDELLQLGVLEEYRDRATHARRGIGGLRDEYSGQLEAIEQRIADKRDQELTETLNALESRRGEIDARLEKLDQQIAEAEETRTAAKETIDGYEERRADVERLDEDIESLEADIAETSKEREACLDRIGSLTDEREEIRENLQRRHADLSVEAGDRAGVEDVHEELRDEDEAVRGEIEEIRIELQKHQQLVEQADNRTEEQRELANERQEVAERRRESIADEEDSLAKRRDELADLREERDRLIEEIDEAGFDDGTEVRTAAAEREDELSEHRERVREREARIEAVSEEIEEMEALVEAGQCPTCGQPVTGAPAVDALDEKRGQRAELEETLDALREDAEAIATDVERLETLTEHADALERLENRIETTEELVEEKAEALEERRETVDTLLEEAAEASDEAAAARERATAARERAEELRDDVAACNTRREELRDRLETLEGLLESYDALDDVEDAIENARDRRESLEALNDERRDRLADMRERRDDLRERIDAERMERARESLEKADQYLERADESRSTLRTERDEVIDRIGGVKGDLAELRELEERKTILESAHGVLDDVHEEVRHLATVYGELRGDLRERNVRILERMINETFDLVYQNDAYDRIALDRDYAFTVYQKDGTELDPSLLSGGERALFNLSLRCAIYRLLAEGIEGTAALPPLILDEPTVYLDAGHVGRLVELVEAMRSIGVEQIVLVSHDEELLRAADVVMTVEKDPTSNRSTVTTSPAGTRMVAQD